MAVPLLPRLFRVLGGLIAALALGLAPPLAAAAVRSGKTAVVQASPWGGSLCDSVASDRAALCRGLESRNCSIVGADHYWLCQGFLTGNCTLIPIGQDYELCRAITTRYCSYVADGGLQILCRGVVQRNCAGLDQQGYAWCVILANALPLREAW